MCTSKNLIRTTYKLLSTYFQLCTAETLLNHKDLCTCLLYRYYVYYYILANYGTAQKQLDTHG